MNQTRAARQVGQFCGMRLGGQMCLVTPPSMAGPGRGVMAQGSFRMVWPSANGLLEDQ
jgi:hypothetical protein